MNSSQIAVIGVGAIGLPLVLQARNNGYSIYGISDNLKEIKRLKNGNNDKNLVFTTQFSKIKNASIVVICVPTPVNDKNHPDLAILQHVTRKVTKYLTNDQLIILESTVAPGTCNDIIVPLLEKSGLVCGQNFFFAYCPERINLGDTKWRLENTPRVIGAKTPKCLNRAKNFYQKILSAKLCTMKTLNNTEAVKLFENAFRLVNVSFVNEFALLCTQAGIDVYDVISGAKTKPFGFLPFYPGLGVGGHCIPKDSYFLQNLAKKNNIKLPVLTKAISINMAMPKYLIDLTIETCNHIKLNLPKSTFLVLGLSYKANIADHRHSRSWEIIQLLKNKGMVAKLYDPFFLKESSFLNRAIALKSADVVIIATDHDEFSNLKISDFANTNVKIVIDGKGCLSHLNFSKLNIVYKAIGLP